MLVCYVKVVIADSCFELLSKSGKIESNCCERMLVMIGESF